MFVILCGKSASGKDTLLKEIVSEGSFKPIVSYTTRPKREGEIDGVDYNFISRTEFEDGILNGDFLEYREYKTKVNNIPDTWFYGIRKDDYAINENYITILDLDGARSFLQHYGKDNCYIVYIDVSDNVRTERAKNRSGFDETEWNRRLIDDNKKFSEDNLDIVNNKLSNENKSIAELVEEFKSAVAYFK